jgi:transcriptional regulator with XRE-family HTH domain
MEPYAAQGRVLRRARERAGKTTEQVGDYLLVGGAAGYEPYERGKLPLSATRVSTLALYLGVEPEAFAAELMAAK